MTGSERVAMLLPAVTFGGEWYAGLIIIRSVICDTFRSLAGASGMADQVRHDGDDEHTTVL
jgi:hypothetical protein